MIKKLNKNKMKNCYQICRYYINMINDEDTLQTG
jgi:hypothetical protein